MGTDDWADFWWQRVAGPHEVVEDVRLALQDNRSVILEVPDDLPWRHEMREAIREELQTALGLEHLSIHLVDDGDDNAEGEEPGRFIVRSFGRQSDILSYRPSQDNTFIARRGILHNSIVWVKGLDKGATDRWLSFCSHWKANSPGDGLLIIEDHYPDLSVRPGPTVIRYSEHVQEYSIQLFNGYTMDSARFRSYSLAWKRYIAALMTCLCGQDVEIAHELLESHDLRQENPLDALRTVDQSGVYVTRGSRADNHILRLVREGARDKIERRIWKAQLEVFFPMIEERRLDIVGGLEANLRDLIGRRKVIQNDEVVESPEDVDLGSLYHLMITSEDGKYLLRIDDQALRSEISLLRTCRNNLAHHHCCSVDQIGNLCELES